MNEISVQASVRVLNGSLQYRTQPTQFQADQSLVGGPSPGCIEVDHGGIAVDFPKLTLPGWCRLLNLDGAISVYWGIYDPTTAKSYLPFVLKPGMPAVFQFSELLRDELTGTGTVSPAQQCHLYLKAAVIGSVRVQVEAFET